MDIFLKELDNIQCFSLDNFSFTVEHWVERPNICWWTRCSICCEWKTTPL